MILDHHYDGQELLRDDSEEWSISFFVTNLNGKFDNTVEIGHNNQATDDYDRGLDVLSPPGSSFTNDLLLTVYQPQWNDINEYNKFCIDFRNVDVNTKYIKWV